MSARLIAAGRNTSELRRLLVLRCPPWQDDNPLDRKAKYKGMHPQ